MVAFLRRAALVSIVLVLSGLLSYVSTGLQVARLRQTPRFVEEVEVPTHEKAFRGIQERSISSIYDYRILAVLVVEAVHRMADLPVDKALTYTLFVARAAVFLMWFYVFYRLRLRLFEVLFAVLFVFYAVIASFYNEGLNLFEPMNQFCFLTFFALVLHGRDAWLLPVVVIGSLAKETAVFMPLLYFAYRAPIDWRNLRGSLRRSLGIAAYTAAMGLTSFGIYLFVRWFFSVNSPTGMLAETKHYGWGATATWFNLTNPYTYLQWIVTFNVLLVLPFCYWRQQPAEMKRALAIFCSIFFAAHFVTARQEETRMFLVLLIVLVPMSIDTLRRLGKEEKSEE